MNELVSIVIPVQNRHELLRETLQSAWNQSYPQIEVIVIDNKSEPVLRKEDLAPCVPPRHGRRLQVLAEPHGNANTARNKGYARSTGLFVLFLDSDDLLVPECIADRRAAFDAHPNASAVIGRCEYFHRTPGDMAEKSWGNWSLPATDLECFLGTASDPWQTAGPLWRRSFLEANDLRWDEGIQKAQDWEFHTRALLAGMIPAKRDRVDHYWRCDPSGAQMSSPTNQSRSHARGDILHTLTTMFRSALAAGYLTDDVARTALRLRGMRSLIFNNFKSARNAGLPWVAAVSHLNNWWRLGLITCGTHLELSCYSIAWHRPILGRPGRSFFHRRFGRELSRPLSG